MQRVLIVGDSNSGKTTLGHALADALGVRFVELDALYWLPGWQGRPPDEFRALLQASLPADEDWVAAGNYTSYRDAFWPRADTGIWLDFPLRITLPRLVRRSWRRYRSKELLWGTNYDRFWPMFKLWDTKASLLSFTVAWHGRRRRMLGWLWMLGALTVLLGALTRYTDAPKRNRSADEQSQQQKAARRAQACEGRFAPAPTPQFLRGLNGPGVNGFAVAPAVQIVRQHFRRAVTTLRIFAQTFHADDVQIRRPKSARPP
jgi:adenylate kinase family enzyme